MKKVVTNDTEIGESRGFVTTYAGISRPVSNR
jgi:hypothetical protein